MISVLRKITILGLSLVLTSCFNKSTYEFEFQNPELSPNQRATSLVAQMTLKEKVSQMRYDAPAIPRLGIPQYNWWNECLHGVGRAGEATVFPQAIGLGATWNEALMFDIGTAVSDEARAKHHQFVKENKRGIYQGLTFWTPNINIFRDPRWGRGQETYGEDPLLTSKMGVNFIKGLQGDDPRYLKVVATAKHFAVHSGPEKSRHEDNYQTSNKDLHETYLPAFKAAIQEAKVASVMCAYNRYRDEACCGSNLLLDSILRQDWGFDGYVVSDCWAINDFYLPERHGVSANAQEASALAVSIGTDLNCGNTFDPNLSEAVLTDLIDEEVVDRALERLMAARFKLGMFDDEALVPWAQIPYEVVGSEKHKALSKRAARESIVLLKNENKLLPLAKEVNTVAVIGPNANTRQALLGNYHGTSRYNITPLQGIRAKLPQANVLYAKGSDISKEWPLLTPVPSENLRSKNESGLLGEYFANSNWAGSPEFSRVDSTVNFTWIERPIKKLKTDTFTVRWTGQLIAPIDGTYRIGLRACNVGKMYINGSLVVEFQDDHQPTMKYHDLVMSGGEGVDVRIDYYNFHADPQVQLLWARFDEDLLTPALEIAKQSDIVIMCLGLSPDIEGEEMPVVMEGFDKGDRSDIQLPSSQRELLKAVVATGKPVVLVLMNGSALAVNYAAQNVPAIIEAWYPGEFGGNAIADVLFGDYNPSGRLPLTYYKSVKHLPDFKSYDMTNRTYKYFSDAPLFPFGYGLSYSKFAYSALTVDSEVSANDPIRLTVDVENIGAYDGDEVVQVYLQMPGVREAAKNTLVAFTRLNIKAGEKKTVELSISPDHLLVYEENGTVSRMKGDLVVCAGGGQPDLLNQSHREAAGVIKQRIKVL